MASRYVSSVSYAAVTQWAATTAYTLGQLRRQLATPTFGNERVFRCTTAGTSGGAEPTWNLTAGSTTADGTAVWTEVTSNATYNNWANAPFANLLSAINLAAAGDTYYVAQDHNETTSSAITLAFPGTGASQDKVLCVNRAGSVPPVAADLTTGAAVTSTAASGTALQTQGCVYFYGVKFTSGSGSSSAVVWLNTGYWPQVYEQCQIVMGGTDVNARPRIGQGQNPLTRLINCTFVFGNVGQGIYLESYVEIIGPSTTPLVAGAIILTSPLIGQGVTTATRAPIIKDVDLSNLGSGSILYQMNTGLLPPGLRFINCKLNASVVVSQALGGTNISMAPVYVIGCHSAANVERNEFYACWGTITTETTIVRTGGATDGTTPYSWKLVPTSQNTAYINPLTTFEGAMWNAATGSAKTLTVHILTDNITLNNNEIWLEVEYLGSATSPLATRITSEPANVLTAAAAVASDVAATWASAPGTPVKQKLALTFTPQMAGPIRWRVNFSRTAGTVYVCPNAELT